MGLSVRLQQSLDHFELDVSFSTRKQVTGLFGSSGAGKSSVLEAIAGLRKAEGRIVFDGEVWLDSDSGFFLPPEDRQVGYAAQDDLLFPHLDVRANLLAGRRAEADGGDSGKSRFSTVCDLLELDGLLSRDTLSLSGGEQQRVALGRALCSAPRLLLFDEPLGSLDLPLRRRILPLLRKVRDELETPMLLVTHDPTEILALCDDLVVLAEGRVLAQGAPSDLLTDPTIWALADREGFENVLHGLPLADEAGAAWSTVRLCEGLSLRVPKIDVHVRQPVLVTIPAQQILIAVGRPEGLSARNYLAAVITSIRSSADIVLIRARLGSDGPELVAEVTQPACDELALEVGKEVFLVIKTTGCKVLASRS